MTIKTRSAFLYDFEVLEADPNIYIDEGAGVLNIPATVGQYSAGDFITELETALNNGGTDTYSVTIDRVSRTITISSTGTFDVLPTITAVNTLTQAGFTIDALAQASHTGDSASGKVYKPQFMLQNYIPFLNDVSSVRGVVSRSPDGTTKASNFGTDRFMSTEFTFITNKSLGVIEYNANGLQDARDFMSYAITKNDMEFLEDRDAQSFTKCVLESTSGSRDGLDYKIESLEKLGLIDVFRITSLKFREKL